MTAADNNPRITWHGHSTAQIDLDGTRLLTDPVLRRRIGHLRREREVDDSVLDSVDAVLVSHAHLDHLDIPSLAGVDRSIPIFIPAGAGTILLRKGFTEVTEVAPGDEVVIGAVTVHVTDADHHVKRLPLGKVTPSVGYLARGSRSIYFAGDTDLFEGMAELSGTDLALLPVSGWGPKLPPGHLNPETAARALQLLTPKIVVPIHWGTYSPVHLRQTDTGHEREFAEYAERLAPDVQVRILEVGSSLDL